MRYRSLASLGLVLAISILPACSRQPKAVIVDASEEVAAGRISPIERGKVRREALSYSGEAVAAWIEGDAKAMKRYFDPQWVELLEKQWAEYAESGRRIVHVHDEVVLDAIEMTEDGTELLIKYKFRDKSYLVDSKSGEKVAGLKPVVADMQLTVAKTQKGEWTIARVIGTNAALR